MNEYYLEGVNAAVAELVKHAEAGDELAEKIAAKVDSGLIAKAKGYGKNVLNQLTSLGKGQRAADTSAIKSGLKGLKGSIKEKGDMIKILEREAAKGRRKEFGKGVLKATAPVAGVAGLGYGGYRAAKD
jgi:hypothetical protein